MHQDLYGEGFLGGDGAPRWTCDETRYAAFKPTTPWFLGSLDPNVGACFDTLWTNVDVRSHLVEAWRQLALRLAKYDNVLGFDPINEPFWGTVPLQTFEAERLAPFYGEVTNAVRSVAPGWLVFAEPSASRNLGFGSNFPKLPFEGVVYSPHAYDPERGVGARLRPRSSPVDAAEDLGHARRGEHHGRLALHRRVRRRPEQAGHRRVHDRGLRRRRRGGREHDVLGLRQEGRRLRPPPRRRLREEGARGRRSRGPYPQRVAGKLLSYGFDANMQTATIQWEPDATVDAPTEIAVPVRLFPRGVTVDCGGCMVEEEPGAVRLRTSPPGNPAVVTIRGR